MGSLSGLMYRRKVELKKREGDATEHGAAEHGDSGAQPKRDLDRGECARGKPAQLRREVSAAAIVLTLCNSLD